MSKLIENPNDVAPFLGVLVPEVEVVAVNVPDPEARSVAKRAMEYLLEAGAVASADEAEVPVAADPAIVLGALQEEMAKAGAKSTADETTMLYAAAQAASLISRRCFAANQWQMAITDYAGFPAAVTTAFNERCYKESADKDKDDDVEDEGEDLCDCEFSLAYGGKILLNNARMHLKRGRRYGLCGPNGAGKSTLMKAIANDQIEGFPSPDELRCIYMEHDIDGCHADTSAIDFICENELLIKMGVTKDDVDKMMTEVGFTDELKNKAVGSLSGGWKMKVALSRAMLQKADILLLDEPTNHLDVANVAWLMDYLCSLKDVTSIMVSHDSGFLDKCCTDILHYERNLKLKKYRGNLSAFVKVRPEAKSYYELAATQIKFTFPEPTYLEGVNSKGKAIIKMTDMSFQYPNTDKPQVHSISVQCSLSSRVGVIGPNGAGKSTMIKVLCGETEKTGGHVWRHPNMRIAYVAQHAFHHLEKHLDWTPNEYIRWRYASGEDREAAGRVDRILTEEEKEKMAAALVIGGVKRVVDKICTRKKGKKGYEYDVQWKNSGPEDNAWLGRDTLVAAGFEKMVNEFDAKEAAAQGMLARPLTVGNVEKHLGNIGLEAEFATHNRMKGLSGGQKVKVVLAAATWHNPHILILDEPTNYLDRESLGALSEAIKTFGGGVVIISHNREFIDSICTERWFVENHTCRVEGQNWSTEKISDKKEDTYTDAWGNTVKVKADKKKLSRKELKALKKKREAAKARGEEVTESDDDWDE
jgi:elongation factor 3